MRNTTQRRALLATFKALADENRLKLFGLLCQREYNVGAMADLLALSESTISHHLAKLRASGLVHLRADGTQRFYRANETALRRFKQQAAAIEELAALDEPGESDDSWIDALAIDEAAKKVLRNYTADGRLTQIPTRRKKLLVVLDWLAGQFEADVMYTEREVNAILTRYHADYASLRRDLVDFGYLRRERGGGKYWLAPEGEI